mmetsp:Transcript_86636/g.158777  ORF Transcript_86636/g.158777 Transcript_86636/m.158777 type:complete len:701 (+) Transcript_86636:616-2718(+)
MSEAKVDGGGKDPGTVSSWRSGSDPTSMPPGDVGEGSSVGTGISVGEEGAAVPGVRSRRKRTTGCNGGISSVPASARGVRASRGGGRSGGTCNSRESCVACAVGGSSDRGTVNSDPSCMMAPWSSSMPPGEVGEGNSVGTGISEGDEGAGLPPIGVRSRPVRRGRIGGTSSVCASAGVRPSRTALTGGAISSVRASLGVVVSLPTGGRDTGTGNSASSVAATVVGGTSVNAGVSSGASIVPTSTTTSPGDVGEGSSVGTGISVGDGGTLTASTSSALGVRRSRAERRGGAISSVKASLGVRRSRAGLAGGTRSSTSSPTPSSVGEGLSVGTGISLGDEGAAPGVRCVRSRAGLAGGAISSVRASLGVVRSRRGGRAAGTCSSTGGASAATVVGGIDTDTDPGIVISCVVSSSCSSSPSSVGEGLSVGTGISVGEGGAAPGVRGVRPVRGGRANGAISSRSVIGSLGVVVSRRDRSAGGLGGAITSDSTSLGVVASRRGRSGGGGRRVAGSSCVSEPAPGTISMSSSEGTSVGTGISVGDEGSATGGSVRPWRAPLGNGAISSTSADGTVREEASSRRRGGGTCNCGANSVGAAEREVPTVDTALSCVLVGSSSMSESRSPGEVGDGCSVGTGISVGDDGAGSTTPAEPAEGVRLSRRIGCSGGTSSVTASRGAALGRARRGGGGSISIASTGTVATSVGC